MEFVTSQVNIGVLGLIIDIFGAFWMALAILGQNKKQQELETTMFWDGNPYLAAAKKENKIFTWTGFILLVLGFLLQLIGQLFYTLVPMQTILLLLLVCLFGSFIFYLQVRKECAKNIPEEFKSKHGIY